MAGTPDVIVRGTPVVISSDDTDDFDDSARQRMVNSSGGETTVKSFPFASSDCHKYCSLVY